MKWKDLLGLSSKKGPLLKKAAAALLALFVFYLMAGCVPGMSAPAPPLAVTLAPGLGAVIGQVSNAAQFWQGKPLYLYAAPYYAGEDGRGFFMLEVDRHPHTRLETDGSFILMDIPPGQYVLVVGPTAQEGRLAVNERQEILVVNVEAGATLDLGRLTLRLEIERSCDKMEERGAALDLGRLTLRP